MRRFQPVLITLFLVLIIIPADVWAGVAILRPRRAETAIVVRGKLDHDLLSKLVLEETNRYRSSKGRPPLVAMTELMKAAQDHADAMAENNFVSHRNAYDRSQRTLTDRIHRVGLNPAAYAENVALTFTRDFRAMVAWSKKGRKSSAPNAPDYDYRSLAKSVVQQWVDSRGHRANILGRSYDQIGLGFATRPEVGGGYERVFCVQTFSGEKRARTQWSSAPSLLSTTSASTLASGR